MKNRVFRLFVAVVLVCCLVVSWSPIRAKAVGVDQFIGVAVDKVGLYAQAGAVSTGAAVFSWVLLGLGLIVTTAQAIDLMNRYTEFTGELETSIYYYPDGSWSYGVDMGFVERVRAFLFDTGVLSDPLLVLSDNDRSVYNAALADYLSTGYESCYVILAINRTATSSGYNKVSFGQYAPVLENGRYSAYDPSGNRAYFVTYTLQGSNYVKTTGGTTPWPGVETYIFRSGGAVSTVLSIELGQVALPEVDIPTGYPEWHINARPATNPDTDEEITILPIPLNPSADPDTQIGTLTQPDVWQGSIADPMPDTGTDPDGSIAETPWEAFKKWISEGWKSIIQAIPTADSIAESIGNVIKSIFVPDADFITEKWNDIRSRFEFADSITSSGQLILDVLNSIDPEPPVIYIDLGASEGSYDIGGEVAFIDLRWYERYKPTGDAIISAFLWLVFIWRMFMKLPGIISGMPGDFVMQGLVDLGLSERLPSRRKEYEYERQQNRRSMRK